MILSALNLLQIQMEICHSGLYSVFFILHVCHIIVTRWDGPGGIET